MAELAVAETPPVAGDTESAREDSQVWRREVAARLNRYQARRKPRPPRYPSLRLLFDDANAERTTGAQNDEPAAYSQLSNHALALDPFFESTESGVNLGNSGSAMEESARKGFEANSHAVESSQSFAVATTAKIIEFPRSWTPPPPPLNELAEPVMTRPRILEAPEIVPPLPALGGITIEPSQPAPVERLPGIDIPIQTAPLARRILSAAIDDIIIAAAGVLFGFIFWKLTAIRPPRYQMLGLVAGVGSLLWAAYQYLLVVHSGTTPGLRLARLELATFNGSLARRGLRRWRVLASFLSALSLGMGYAWVFLDEDSLCWHDRITRTFLAPKPPRNRARSPS